MKNTKNTNPDLEIPSDLSPLGKKVAKAILKTLKKHDMLHTGGCKLFYSTQEWADRGEKYGIGSELIIVYDGASARHFFEFEYSDKFISEMMNALEPLGVYSECCTSWYSAIYKI